MTKFIKISLLTGILCLVFGTGLFIAGAVMGGGKFAKNLDFSSMLTTDSKHLKKEYATLKKTKIDDFDKIDVKLNTIDIKIAESDDNNCYIEYNLKKENGEIPVIYEVDNKEFKLRQKSNHVSINMDLSGLAYILGGAENYVRENQVVLYIPEGKTIAKSEIDTSDGDVKIEGLKSDNLNLSVDYGDTKLENSEIRNGRISSADGDIDVRETKLENIEINDSYGDVKCKQCSFSNVNVKLSAGEIKIYNPYFEGDVKLESSFGDVKIESDDELKDTSIDAKTSFGDVKVSSNITGERTETSFERNIENQVAKLQIKCSDGDIRIR